MVFNPDNPDEHAETQAQTGLFGGDTPDAPPVDAAERPSDPTPAEYVENIPEPKASRLTEAELRGLIRTMRDEQKITAEAVMHMAVMMKNALGRIEKLLAEYRPMHPTEMLQLIKTFYLLETGEELDDWLVEHHKPPLTESTLDEYVNTGKHDSAAMDKVADKAEGKTQSPACPKCGGEMQERRGKYGRFWGCTNFKATGCKGSIDIDPKPWAKGGDSGGSTPPPKDPTPDGGDFVDF